jgi:hypothetical protein
MAARFHPDNPVSGDHEIFLQLCKAYEVLARPDSRELYDRALRVRETEPIPLFAARIFVDGLDGELNRRFGILALLYQRRRTNPGNLGISALELETRMALPREHLEFTVWYLRSKGFVQIQEDNSDYAVTAAGVDYVEANSSRNPILRELLTAGSFASRPASPSPEPERGPRRRVRSMADAKRALVDLCQRSRKKAVRGDMVPRPGSGRTVGPGYVSQVIQFVGDTHAGWKPEAAAKRAPSLCRCLLRLRELAGSSLI